MDGNAGQGSQQVRQLAGQLVGQYLATAFDLGITTS